MQLSRSVVIPANMLSARIAIGIVDDTETEEDEFFTVRAFEVSSPASVCQGISSTTITIRRNDQGKVHLLSDLKNQVQGSQICLDSEGRTPSCNLGVCAPCANVKEGFLTHVS